MTKSFDEVFEDYTKYGTKIKTEEYCESGEHIIIDQGQEQIAGYTDLEDGLFEHVPAIVFGDHTRVIKYVDTPFFLGADGVKVLRSKFTDANYKYLYYALKNARIPNTGYNRHFKWLKETRINYPNTDRQAKLVGVLDGVTGIIEKRQQQLSALDDLIKARFVEMFGDPIVNPKGYPIVPISDLFDVGSSKRVFESEWRSEGVPFYRAREIVKLSKDGFVDNDLFIEEGLYEKYKAKYGVPKAGDMMVTGVGTLGICYIVQPNDRFYFKDGNTLWFKNKGLCNVRFIMEQYNTDFVRGQIEANANVSTVGTYTITNANNTMILLPSIEEQNEFDSFVSQVDKSKSVIQKALDETQLLFDSLMQEYFG